MLIGIVMLACPWCPAMFVGIKLKDFNEAKLCGLVWKKNV